MSDFARSDTMSGPDPEKQESSEERIAWLRDRGVIIEIPNEKTSPNTSSRDRCNVSRIVVVKISADDRKDYQEVEVEIDASKSGDQLLIELKPFFQVSTETADDGGTLDMKMLENTMKNSFGNTNAVVSPSTFKELAMLGNVEAFSLSHPCDDNNFTAVSFYLDEIGQLKHLDVNRRAVALANSCGLKNVPICGDVYVGRTRRLPNEKIVHENFRVADLDSDALWLRNVETQNYQYGLKTNQVAMQNHERADDEVSKGEDVAKGYRWSETSSTVEVVFFLPSALSKKELSVVLKSRSLVIKNLTDKTTLLELPSLRDAICADDSTWIMGQEGGRPTVEISMEKMAPGATWRSLLAE